MFYKHFCSLILVVLLVSCKKEIYTTSEITAQRIPIDSNIEADTLIANFIEPYSQRINEVLDSVVAYNPLDLDKSDGELNTAIGNLMADIVLEQASPVFLNRTGEEIDMVILNHGGIRSRIDKGAVTARTAYQLMPFENEIVVAELSGEKLKELISYLESNRTAHPISGLRIKMNESYKVIDARINEQLIRDGKTYFVATSDYLQQGGDNMNFFKDPVSLTRTDYKIRNAFIDYFNKIDTIKASRDNRYIRVSR